MYRILVVAAPVALSASASAAFTGFAVTYTALNYQGIALERWEVFAQFNGPTDTLVNCFNLRHVGAAETNVDTPLTGFWHKDNASSNGGVLSQTFGTWNPSQTGSATLNRPYDSYLTIGGQATATNTTSADPAWTSGGNADLRSWNRPDLPDNGTIGWFNSSPPNLQGRVGIAPNTATDVKIGQFVATAGEYHGCFELTVGYQGPGISAVSFATGTFGLHPIPEPACTLLLAGIARGKRRRS